MKRSRFTDEQIIGILKGHQAGLSASELCRRHGISGATFYTWRRKFGQGGVGGQTAEDA
jgi:putative transposase